MRVLSDEAGSWIWTISGRRFSLTDPRPEDVDIEDIAHSLSLQCRFGGHVRGSVAYTVAQHSVHVSELCRPEDALWGLMHDASEAYVVDLPRPVKVLPGIREPYAELETRVQRTICLRFGMGFLEPESVRDADNRVVYAEMLDLMPSLPSAVRAEYILRAPDPATFAPIHPWPAPYARDMFMRRFDELYRGSLYDLP